MCGEYTLSGQTRRGHVTYVSKQTGKIRLKEIKYSFVNGRAVFEGDIVLGTEEQIRMAEEQGTRDLAAGVSSDSIPVEPTRGMVVQDCVIVGSHTRWPDGIIPYTIHPALPSKGRVTEAIEDWHLRTYIRFVERTDQEDYLTIIPSIGCWAQVGRQGGQQWIGLADNCSIGNTIHELGHTVGLWHEQSREDRDQFVTINWNNIIEGEEHNFEQHIADGDDVGRYDYNSIMHYSRTAFGIDGAETITPPPGVTIREQEHLSLGDKAAVLYMYGYTNGPSWEYIGNARTKELHHCMCDWLQLMAPQNERIFQTIEEGITSGYNGCYYCLRDYDTG